MRIAFVGKGGSGKSTSCAAFIQYLRQSQSRPVLAIDADVNRHLPPLLGITEQPISLALQQDAIFTNLRGSRQDIEKFVSTTPPSHGSQFIYPHLDDPFITRYAQISADRRVALLSVGRYETADVGDSCYHGKLYTLAAVMHHMLDQPDEWVIADSTAGTDGLATSLYYAYDAYVYVVEPTVKSVQVYHDFIAATADNAKPVFVIVNKFEPEDQAFIDTHLAQAQIIATIPNSPLLRRFEQGDPDAFAQFCTQIAPQMQQVQKTLSTITRDYTDYYKQLVTLHNQLSASWADVYYQASLNFTAHADFDYTACFQPVAQAA